METILAQDIKARFAEDLPTLYVDVRPEEMSMTFAIIEKIEVRGACGGMRCSVREIKNKLERLKTWAIRNPEHLVILGCTTPHKYSEGIAAMLPILRGANISVKSIHGSHYQLYETIGSRIPTLII